jgi:hypothetical protein
VGAAFLEHSVRLNDLFVDLLLFFGGRLQGVNGLARWLSSESTRLPWREYDREVGREVGRSIQPDATIEIPVVKERWFLECEMGTHPVTSSDPERVGATRNKFERYSKYLTLPVGLERTVTCYSKAFPDGYRPVVVFLATSDSRRAAIAELIKQAQRTGLVRLMPEPGHSRAHCTT